MDWVGPAADNGWSLRKVILCGYQVPVMMMAWVSTVPNFPRKAGDLGFYVKSSYFFFHRLYFFNIFFHSFFKELPPIKMFPNSLVVHLKHTRGLGQQAVHFQPLLKEVTVY